MTCLSAATICAAADTEETREQVIAELRASVGDIDKPLETVELKPIEQVEDLIWTPSTFAFSDGERTFYLKVPGYAKRAVGISTAHSAAFQWRNAEDCSIRANLFATDSPVDSPVIDASFFSSRDPSWLLKEQSFLLLLVAPELRKQGLRNSISHTAGGMAQQLEYDSIVLDITLDSLQAAAHDQPVGSFLPYAAAYQAAGNLAKHELPIRVVRRTNNADIYLFPEANSVEPDCVFYQSFIMSADSSIGVDFSVYVPAGISSKDTDAYIYTAVTIAEAMIEQAKIIPEPMP